MFDDALLDDTAALQRIDAPLRTVAGWGAEVRRTMDAATAGLQSIQGGDRPRAVAAAGADGRLFRAVLEPVCPVPFVAWPHAWLPGWAGPLDLVIVLSSTGSDQESLALASEAVRRGSRLLVTAPDRSSLAEIAARPGNIVLAAGSADPLALAVPVLMALHRLGLGPALDAEAVALSLDAVALACGPSRPIGDNPAKDSALVLADTVPVLWGGSMLAARAARRVAEALRTASGRPALAGEVDQLIPVFERAPSNDIFADPFDAETVSVAPALLILDDGIDGAAVRESRGRLVAAATAASVRVHTITSDSGPDVGRFASLMALGRFTALYLGAGLEPADVRDSGFGVR